MKKTILTVVIALTACAASAFAADYNGSIEIGSRYNDVIGNGGKANEYRDSSTNQGIANFGFSFADKGYYLDLNGKSGISLDSNSNYSERTDQSYRLQGGQYESFKYFLDFNEIPHNMTFDAQTLYLGTGSYILQAPVSSSVSAPSATQNAATVATTKTNVQNLKNAELAAPKYSVDYSLIRRNAGAGFEVSLKTPFFLSTRVERNETSGTLPLGTYLGQEKELPLPISYTTDNLYLETGYRTKDLTVTVDGMMSQFTENTPFLYVGFTNANQFISTNPNNQYYKVGGSVRYNLPVMNSTLMARGSYSKTTNDQTLFDPSAVAGRGFRYNGDISYTTAAASLTSNPTKELDTRMFFNYLNKENDSTKDLNYSTSATPNLTEGFGYHKINAGLDVGYKLPAKTRLSAGYEYLHLVQPREDATNTTDNTVYLQLKNTFYDWMSAKVRYQRLYRNSEYMIPVNPTGQAGEGYMRPYDLATMTQDAVKTQLEFEPMHNVSLGVEYAFKYNQYPDSIMGVQNATKHDVNFDATIVAGMFKFNPYVDLEFSQENSKHRNASTANTNNIFINGPNASGIYAYNWQNKADNTYYALGINTEAILIKDTLIANLGTRYENSDGSENFSTMSTSFDPVNPVRNNGNVDNFIRKSITGKLTAFFSKQLKGTISYTYEKLQYQDDHYALYNNFSLLEAGAGYALTGAYNNPDYTAHIAYASLTYSF
jgi:hypothetical protein